MSKQIIATVYLGGNSQSVAFNTDMIYLQESVGTSPINCNVYYFGNPLAPTIATNIYQVSETVTSLVTASDNALVQATIWRINSSGKFSSSQQFAFPVSGYLISESSGDSDIQSIIAYRNNNFSAEETQADLVTAANAGGGGGGSTLFALSGSNTATGEVTAQLDGNEIEILDGEHQMFYIDPEEDAEIASMRAINDTGGGNLAYTYNATSDVQAQSEIQATFDVSGAAKSADILLISTSEAATITQTADTIRFNGNFGINNDPNKLFDVGTNHLITMDSNGNGKFGGLANIQTDSDDILSLNGSTMEVNGQPTFNGTLADAISGAKSVVNGLIVD